MNNFSKKKTGRWLLGLCFAIGLIACEDTVEYTSSPRENFEALWQILDENYCFFEYKEVDWDEVHDRYEHQIVDTMDQFALFDVLGDMLAELKDGHTNLSSPFDMSRYWAWYEDYPDNFDEKILENYLGTDYRIAGGMRYRTLADEQIGYIYYPSFSSGVGETNLDYILYQFKDCMGLIIDIRNNGGGMLTYSDRIAARFIEGSLLTGYIQHKMGPGHDEFSEPYALTLAATEGHTLWYRPVIVLTNRQCYSSANDFVQAMRLLPQVRTMGDKTGGGSGFPYNSELPNGWLVRFSASRTLGVDYEQLEFGIEPDIPIAMKETDADAGKDTILETAIQLLLTAQGDPARLPAKK